MSSSYAHATIHVLIRHVTRFINASCHGHKANTIHQLDYIDCTVDSYSIFVRHVIIQFTKGCLIPTISGIISMMARLCCISFLYDYTKVLEFKGLLVVVVIKALFPYGNLDGGQTFSRQDNQVMCVNYRRNSSTFWGLKH